MIKTFRGLLADGGQDRLRLSTMKGKVGYRITDFRIVTINPATFANSTMQIWKTEQSTVPTVGAVVDFSNSDLLAVANWVYASGEGSIIDSTIFDNEIFNQDIYITHTEELAAIACNYYIELEVISLSDQAAEYTTIKDIRSNA